MIFGLKINHNLFYYWGLVLMVVSLPISKFLLSISFFVIVINWIIEGNYKEKYQILKRRKSIMVFLIVYFVHIIALIYTSNFEFAFHDLKIKLPLLLLPIVIGTSKPIKFYQLKHILLWFIASVFVASLISSAILFGIVDYPISDFRDISIFISHIRFSLMINLSIFSILYFFISDYIDINRVQKPIFVFLIVWFIVFLFLLKSLTGIIIFCILTVLLSFYLIRKIKKIILRNLIRFSLIFVFLFIGVYTYNIYKSFTDVDKVDLSKLETNTKNGNPYTHNLKMKQIENGNYIWINVCFKELEQEWSKRSEMTFDGFDKKGQKLKFTLVRYLTSKGLKKDAEGMLMLSDTDISNIENGMANYLFAKKYSLYPRIYQLFWQIDNLKKGFDYSGHSSVKRIIYVKTAIKVIERNFLFGVGTGDVKDELQKQYVKDNSILPKSERRMAHNQFVSFFHAFGLVGFVLIIFAFIYPIFYEKMYKNYLFCVFFIIAFLSMLNEDTIETHIGISFVILFYSLFIFGMGKRTNIIEQNNT
ncbi:MAG: O-antigen ligase family protein [Bacteroidota bacterium]|nr:O-antigen ligase family protein [Bacteroidota bacterium]